MSFDKLMEELDVLAKSQAAAGEDDGDEKIQAAAGVDEGAGLETEGVDEGADPIVNDATDDVDGIDDEGEPMGKSLSFTLEDGQVIEAVDGTELVKALMDRTERNEANFTEALSKTLDLVKSQGEMIKSLQDQLKQVSSAGRGRKAVVSVAERPTIMAKAQQEDGIPPQEFLAKCLQAQAAGKITGADVSRAEAYLNRGLQVPAEIVARVASV